MPDEFLGELWDGREKEAKHEVSQAFRIYQDIWAAVKGAPELEKQQRALEQAILSYYGHVKRTLHVQEREGGILGDLEHSDEARHSAHKRIFDELNILSRMCVANKRPAEWRRALGMGDFDSVRTQIGEWAATVGKELEE